MWFVNEDEDDFIRTNFFCASTNLANKSITEYVKIMRKCLLLVFCAAGNAWFYRSDICSLIRVKYRVKGNLDELMNWWMDGWIERSSKNRLINVLHVFARYMINNRWIKSFNRENPAWYIYIHIWIYSFKIFILKISSRSNIWKKFVQNKIFFCLI